MKIGITYDLRQAYLDEGYGEEETAEFDRPDTIDSIERTLQELGYETDRIGNIRQLVARLAKGDRWDLVFNIAEGLKGFGREAQIPALLEAYNIPCTFSDPMVLALSLHKGMTKRVLRDAGLPTADFAIVETEEDIDKVNLEYPLFAKPIAEGTAKGVTNVSKLHNYNELNTVCRNLLKKYKQPVLVETFLPGREVTVGIVGTGKKAKVLGVVEVILKENAEAHAYTYVNKENCEELTIIRLVDDAQAQKAAKIALGAHLALNCRDTSRVDIREDVHGEPMIMEINPLPGLHPAHSDLPILCTLAGIPYKELFKEIMLSAVTRVNQ